MMRWVVGSILDGSSQCSTTGVTKAVVCVILSVGWCIYTIPLLLIDKSGLCGGSGFPFSLSEWSLTICLIKMYWGGGGRKGVAKLFTCPYPLKVQAPPLRDQRLATEFRVSGGGGEEGRYTGQHITL